MSTHIVGFRPPDDQWARMKGVYRSCQSAGVPIPKAVLDFFDGEDPKDLPGKEVPIKAEPWRDEGREGYQVDLTKLPKDVRYLRFYNSW